MVSVRTMRGGTAADEGRLGDPALAVTGEITDHLAAPRGVSDVDGIVGVGFHGQFREVIGVVVHVVALAGLCRTTVSTAIVGDDPEAVVEKDNICVSRVVG